MISLRNPRDWEVVDNWPHGGRRVAARFEIERNKRGARLVRVTTGKPKHSTYYEDMKIVDGDDGKLYAVAITEYEQVVLLPGTLKHPQYFYENSEEYGVYKQILLDAVKEEC